MRENVKVALLGKTIEFNFYLANNKIIFKNDSQAKQAIMCLLDKTGNPEKAEIKRILMNNQYIHDLRNKSTNSYDEKTLKESFISEKNFNFISSAFIQPIKQAYARLENKALAPLMVTIYNAKYQNNLCTQKMMQEVVSQIADKKCKFILAENKVNGNNIREVCKNLNINISNEDDIWNIQADVLNSAFHSRKVHSQNEILTEKIIQICNDKFKKSKNKKIREANPTLTLRPSIANGPYSTYQNDVYLEITRHTDNERIGFNMEIAGGTKVEYIDRLKTKMIESSLSKGTPCYFLITNKETDKQFKFTQDELDNLSYLEKKVLQYNLSNTLKAFDSLSFLDNFYIQLSRMYADAGLEKYIPKIEEIKF